MLICISKNQRMVLLTHVDAEISAWSLWTLSNSNVQYMMYSKCSFIQDLGLDTSLIILLTSIAGMETSSVQLPAVVTINGIFIME